ncbi:MAG: class III poly(R)-hydroxyalkanoic acid synthase subunit PhaC [Candidatus Nitrosocosmicus sp.]
MNEIIFKQFLKDYTLFVKYPDNAVKLQKMRSLLSGIENIKTGLTEYEIIRETPLFRLLHYKPIKEQAYESPVLIVYALINKSYIFDLQENRSWVRNLLDQGLNVYLLDWKSPSKLDKFTTIDDYVNYFIYECVEQIKKIENVKQISLQGYCMGATMSLMYTSLYQKNIRNLITIAPVVDTAKDKSVIKNMAQFMDVDKVLSQHENFPVEFLYLVFSILKPFKQNVNKYFNLFDNLEDQKFVQNFLRIEKWIYDTPPIAGEAFRQWVKDIYQKNLLAKNKLIIGDSKINLSDIKVPILNVVAEADHLVTPDCSISLNDLISSEDKSLMKFPTGHVGLIASGFSQKMVLPKIGKWIKMH